MDKNFSSSQRTLRKCIVDDSALPGVDWYGSATPRVNVVNSLWPDLVVLALLDVAFGSEYVPVRCGSVQADTIWPKSELRTYSVIRQQVYRHRD